MIIYLIITVICTLLIVFCLIKVKRKWHVVIDQRYFEERYGYEKWSSYSPEERKSIKDETFESIDRFLEQGDKSNEESVKAGYPKDTYRTMFTGGFLDDKTRSFTPYLKIQNFYFYRLRKWVANIFEKKIEA